MSDSKADPVFDWWLKELQLYDMDKEMLLNGHELSDALVNASQCILDRQFPQFAGFQSTLLGQRLKDIKFKSFSRGFKSVQILNSRMHYRIPVL